MAYTAYEQRFIKVHNLPKDVKPLEVVELRAWLCRELGKRLILMSKAAVGHPMVPPYFPEGGDWDDVPKDAYKQWRKDLKKAGKALVYYSKAEDLTLDQEVVAMKEATAAMHWVATYLPNLWV